MPIYANAADVLPLELLTEVRKHWNGYLYVPCIKEDKMQNSKTEAVLRTIRSGAAAYSVAEVYDLSLWQVYRLARRLGDGNPYAGKRKKTRP